MADEIKKTSTEIEYFESLLRKRISDWSQEELEAYGDKDYVREKEKDLRKKEKDLRKKEEDLRKKEEDLRDEKKKLREKEKDLRDERKRLLDGKKSIHDVLRDKMGTILPQSADFVSGRWHRRMNC